jgi:orotate phosphoribosyltransferase
LLPADQLKDLALTLFEIGAVRLGRFTLHSGRISPIYLDLRLLVSYPAALRQVIAAYRPQLDKLAFDLLAATPLAGLPIGTALCLELDVPLVYPRPPKGHGTGKQIEGHWRSGQTAVAIDDLVTSGDSVLGGIRQLEEAGLRVKDAVVLIDREQGGREMLQEKGITLHSAASLGQLLMVLEKSGRITPEQRLEVVHGLRDRGSGTGL